MNDKIKLFASPDTWIEGESMQQLERVANLPGMTSIAAFPDLHPGKGGPVGVAMLTKGVIYPYLIGSDIGCGMALFATDMAVAKFRAEKWSKKLSVEGSWDGDTAKWLLERNADPEGFASSIGTIGLGNHFTEVLRVNKVLDESAFYSAGCDAKHLYILVHSGSRGLGEMVLRSHVELHRDGGLNIGSEEATRYLERHNNALRWAAANRALIAYRFIDQIGGEQRLVVDLAHNSITKISTGDTETWLHRKGAAPTDKPLIVIPGSRGAYSYLVSPTGNQTANLWSVAHGAGRRWNRSECEGRLRQKYPPDQMKKTRLGSYVICDDKDLLYEEAPQAYKDIKAVISDMVSAGLITVVAEFEPMLTYKTRGR